MSTPFPLQVSLMNAAQRGRHFDDTGVISVLARFLYFFFFKKKIPNSYGLFRDKIWNQTYPKATWGKEENLASSSGGELADT